MVLILLFLLILRPVTPYIEEPKDSFVLFGKLVAVEASGSVYSRKVEKAVHKPVAVAPKPHGATRITGIKATWYCDSKWPSRCTKGYGEFGKYAAISPEFSSWRGHLVNVCNGKSNCVVVKIIDCNCQAHHAIDLYHFAFKKIGGGAGRITVTLERIN